MKALRMWAAPATRCRERGGSPLSGTSMLALLLTAVHLVLPGAAVALAARVRPLLAVLTAPAVSFGLIALASRVTSATGLAWAPLSFWLLVLLFAGVVAGLRWLSRRLPAAQRLPWGGPREDVEGTRRER